MRYHERTNTVNLRIGSDFYLVHGNQTILWEFILFNM